MNFASPIRAGGLTAILAKRRAVCRLALSVLFVAQPLVIASISTAAAAAKGLVGNRPLKTKVSSVSTTSGQILAIIKQAERPESDEGRIITSNELRLVLATVLPGGVDASERRILNREFQKRWKSLGFDGNAAAIDLVTGEHFQLPSIKQNLRGIADSEPIYVAPVILGQFYVGYGTNELNSYTGFGGDEFQPSYACTSFVSWILKKVGWNDRVFWNGDELHDHLLSRPDWHEVPDKRPMVGDVVRLLVKTHRGSLLHTVLVSRIIKGNPIYLGANYPNNIESTQVISERNLPDAEIVWVLRYDKGRRP